MNQKIKVLNLEIINQWIDSNVNNFAKNILENADWDDVAPGLKI